MSDVFFLRIFRKLFLTLVIEKDWFSELHFMAWEKVKIVLDDGSEAYAQAPYIISASRATDIPAFYMDWFVQRLAKGYSAWTNPFTGWKTYVSYQNLELVVFWSKNPKPLLDYAEALSGYDYYVQYTLNNYEPEGLEPNLPPLEERIDTFKTMVGKLGLGKVIWRFDPLLLTDKLTPDVLLDRIRYIGDRLTGYTEKLVFSFVDISEYHRVTSNLKRENHNVREFTVDEMLEFAEKLSEMNRDWGFQLATCCEKIALEHFDIQHNKCIDDDLIVRLFPDNAKIRKLLGIEILPPDMFCDTQQIIKTRRLKDKGQRQFCGCIVSKDIGEYNTCLHGCRYCYANDSLEKVEANWQHHLANVGAETITG